MKSRSRYRFRIDVSAIDYFREERVRLDLERKRSIRKKVILLHESPALVGACMEPKLVFMVKRHGIKSNYPVVKIEADRCDELDGHDDPTLVINR